MSRPRSRFASLPLGGDDRLMMGVSRHCRRCRTTRSSGDSGTRIRRGPLNRITNVSRPFDAGVPAVGLIRLSAAHVPLSFRSPLGFDPLRARREREHAGHSLRKPDSDSES